MSNNHSPVNRARKLRREMTNEEKILWQRLRGRKFMGLKFLRQHPIVYDRINYEPKYFIPDFYCAEKKIVIEINGRIHDFQKQKDLNREEILEGAGIKVIRFKNEEINININEVLMKIGTFIKLTHPDSSDDESSLSMHREG